MGAIGRFANLDNSHSEIILGFFEVNRNKATEGYIDDLNKIVGNPSIQVPLMIDNCSTML